jgi:hypothetical protein
MTKAQQATQNQPMEERKKKKNHELLIYQT